MTVPPRIVSLLPSATEIVVALGLGEQLVGRSHECDYPAWVARLPVCTSTILAKGLSSIEIDNRVQAIVSRGLSVYEVDSELLRALRPDIILTQSQCAVCAVTPRDLKDALGNWVGIAPELISLAPDRLADIWGDMTRVGEATGVCARAENLVERLQGRLEALAGRRAASRPRPTIAAIEWTEPLMAAGNWVPELIEIAGGRALFMAPGQHSAWLDWSALVDQDPALIVMMPCGYRISQTLAELPAIAARADWQNLAAVRAGRVFVADGHHFFNRPGPRLVESAEIIAAIVDAEDWETGSLDRGWLRLPAPPAAAIRRTDALAGSPRRW